MKKLVFFALIMGIITSLLLVSCSGQTTTSSTTTSTTSSSQTTFSQTSSTTSSIITTQPSGITTTSSVSTTPSASNWWDKFGEPKYGGTINIPTFGGGSVASNFDPRNTMGNFFNACYDTLLTTDWTLDRNIFPFQSSWAPNEYWKGCLAESWEWKDTQTMVIKLRQDVHWQDKAPMNGREFTADDVQFHYDRILGTGSGFTTPNPAQAGFASAIERFIAQDKYTVVAKFKNPSVVKNTWSVMDQWTQFFEPPEVVQQFGDFFDWKYVVGTGPFMLTDVIQGSAITLTKNPNYWGYDERHPQNRLPYVDTFRTISIGDMATTLAALRTQKIDLASEVSWVMAQNLKQSNPELVQDDMLHGANVVYFAADRGPFIDIRVRKACQMAFDRKSVAKDFYKGNADPTPYGVIFPMYKEWCYAYKDWPATLQSEYSYNLKEAKRLMTEAGYPNGLKTEILAPNSFDIELLQIIKANWINIGIDLDIQVMDRVVVEGIIGQHKQKQMDYGIGGSTANWIMLNNFTSTGQNRASHHDTNFDAVVNRFMTAQSLAECKQASIEADKYTIEQHWALRPGILNLYQIWQPYLKGYSGEKLGVNMAAVDLFIWARCWIDQ